MENIVSMLMFLIFGILFIWYSQHNASFKKTAADQGIETAKKKFRVIKWCGYLLVIGAVIFGIFIIIDM
jgi:TRAP-type C4-dicarboxylate transport system permease small subunit